MAFVLSRPFRRLRLPLELLVAKGIATAFPAVAQIKISLLYRSAMPASRDESGADDAKKGSTATGSTLASDERDHPQPPPSTSTLFGAARRAGTRLVETIDKYGAAYMVGSRLVGTTIVFGIYGSLHLGLDVESILHALGLADVETVGTVLGTWAAAVVMSSAFLPVTMSCTAITAPAMAKMRKSWFT
ncbi:hypothetical protein SARC_02759 [Sphaeroforma arctica JP610]|uniref:DUF1279 domain-containing protein n=1 Tax=Sphaeroforma arctica JP610 TaxID=667725 RepID=A0A0L0G7Y5_9EUKA|nr:hypothetical protein SARC_02759 [Sphaeroforma arctica JP610]KNC85034.1 hypothetical protein SARC_02759 [Sphaeroforma arctica JP610]|eukprot:XP_014158936.1 hypothetical protein SARC_02759 [Sphaeroforma arctica JP610]